MFNSRLRCFPTNWFSLKMENVSLLCGSSLGFKFTPVIGF